MKNENESVADGNNSANRSEGDKQEPTRRSFAVGLATAIGAATGLLALSKQAEAETPKQGPGMGEIKSKIVANIQKEIDNAPDGLNPAPLLFNKSRHSQYLMA